ncbi:MAG: alpha/beta hydrolase [Bacteroidales bacterium]|jgi:pimeloyl-ACP methyl ester carboxylesterase
MKRTKLIIINCLALSLVLLISCKKEIRNYALSSDGVRISFSVNGKGNPPLVFVHGFMCSECIWRDQVSYFSQKYEVVTIDLAGFGASGNNREKWGMVAFGKDVAAVVNKLHLRNVILIGHSMGAPVIIEAAKIIPDRISGLVIVDFLQNIETKYPEELIGKKYRSNMDFQFSSAPFIKKIKFAFKNNPEEVGKKLISMCDTIRPDTLGWHESYYDCFRWLNEDCTKSLEAIQTPIISINSDQNPTNIEAFREYHPEFEVKIIQDVYHFVFLEAPEKFNLFLEESINEFKKASKK